MGSPQGLLLLKAFQAGVIRGWGWGGDYTLWLKHRRVRIASCSNTAIVSGEISTTYNKYQIILRHTNKFIECFTITSVDHWVIIYIYVYYFGGNTKFLIYPLSASKPKPCVFLAASWTPQKEIYACYFPLNTHWFNKRKDCKRYIYSAKAIL